MALSQDVLFKFLAIDAGAGSEFDKMAGKATGLSSALGPVGKALFAVGGAAAAVAATVAVESLRMAAGYQSALTRLETGAGESTKGLAVVQARLLKLAGPLGESATSLAQAMYPIESAGFHAANGVKILTYAVQGAKADGADIGTVADAVTSALNAYGLGANHAKGVTNEFVKAVSLGKVPMQDLAASIGSVIPEAAALNVPLSQVLAGITTMTMQGTNAAKASQFLRFALASLANPTSKATGELQSLGLSSAALGDAITKHGLVAGFQKLEDAVGNKFPKGSHQYLAALANIVGGTRGLQAVLELTGRHMGEFNSSTKQIAGSLNDTGKNVEGWGKYTKTFQYNLDAAKGAVNALMIELGEKLLPEATKALQWFTKQGVPDLEKFFNFLNEEKGTIGAFAAFFIQAFELIQKYELGWVKAMIDGADDALGWVPGIGPKLGAARKAFDTYYNGVEGAARAAANALYGLGNAQGTSLTSGLEAGIDKGLSGVLSSAANLMGKIAAEVGHTPSIGGGGHSGGSSSGGHGRSSANVMGQNSSQDFADGALAMAQRIGPQLDKTGRLLFGGLENGFHGAAKHLLDSLPQSVQTALTNLATKLNGELSKATDKLKSDVQSRNQAISSLKDTIAGNSDISNVLGQTDANGNPVTVNVGQYLSSQVGPLKAMAAGLARLRKAGLSQLLIAQISQMAPTDAVDVINQILSGADGSIASLNASEKAIRAAAGSAASTTVNSPHEIELLKTDKEQVTQLKHVVRLLEKRVADKVSHEVHITVNGHDGKYTQAEAKKILQIIEKYEHRQGKKP